MIHRSVGKGRLTWVAAPIEAEDKDPHKRVFTHIIKKLSIRPFAFQADAPSAIEVILFHQPDRKRYLVSLINGQDPLPPVTAHCVKVRFQLVGRTANAAVMLPEETPVTFAQEGDQVQLECPPIQLFQMLAVDYV